jgi:hypothetical protein
MSTLAGQPPLAFVRRPPGHVRCVAAVWMLTVGLTAAGVLLGRLVPALAPGGTPHATLHGSAGEGAGILLHNLRVLAAPVILAGARWAEHRATRLAGDTIVAAIVVCSPLTVGAAIGRHGPELVRFLPHVPLEWAALSIAAAAWLTVRRGGRLASLALVAYAIAVLVAAMAAAMVETVAVPHVARHAPDRTPDLTSGVRPPQPPEVQAVRPSPGLTTRPPRCCVRVVRPCSGRPWVSGAAAAEQEGHDGGAGIGHGVKQQGSQNPSLARGVLGPAGKRRRQGAAVCLRGTPPCGGVPASPAITLRVGWRSPRDAAVRRDARSARDDAARARRARS